MRPSAAAAAAVALEDQCATGGDAADGVISSLDLIARLQAVHSSTCNNAVYEAVGAARTDRNCSSALAWWTVVFSFFELFLSQIPDFHSLW